MNPKKWTIRAILDVTAGYLEQKKIDNPRLCAEILLAHQLKINRINLYLSFDQPLNEQEIDGFRSLVKRRVNREPIQYITGIQEFWSLEFDVDQQVLIPRPESELLVEQVLYQYRHGMSRDIKSPSILDLGTGSGVLAISIASEIESALIWATDISGEALDLARSNSEKHKLKGRIEFIQGDLWEPVKALDRKFDFIVSNPPYIATEEFDELYPEVREYEPRLALEGFQNGMHFIKRIISDSAGYLNSRGWLLMEMDPRQMDPSLELLKKTGEYSLQKKVKDYSNKNRVVIAKRISSQ